MEVLLYIALFSFLAMGFITFSFGFSRAVGLSRIQSESVLINSHIHELIRYNISRSRSWSLSGEGADSSVLLSGESGTVAVSENTIKRLLKGSHMQLVLVGFARDPRDEQAILATYILNKKQYTIRISGP